MSERVLIATAYSLPATLDVYAFSDDPEVIGINQHGLLWLVMNKRDARALAAAILKVAGQEKTE